MSTDRLSQVTRKMWAERTAAYLLESRKTEMYFTCHMRYDYDMTDLEFRLYFGIPAQFYYGTMNNLRLARKFK